MSEIWWQGTGIVSLGIWTYLSFFRRSFWRLRERLEARLPENVVVRSVAAVIPARDEEELIGFTVRSLRSQQFKGDLQIVVANDESSDRTAVEASAAGADVVAVGPRPRDWKGKLWAVAAAVNNTNAGTDYLLLTDADIEYGSPHLLQALIRKAETGFDLVSVMVRLRCESVAEKFLIPAFVFFFFKLYPPGVPAAAGGCVLLRREMLTRIGGIASIRNALIDDCALAQKVAAEGGQVWLGISDLPLRSVRVYNRATEIRAMIARSAFAQLKHSGILLAGTVLAMALTYFAPVLLLFSGDLIAALLGASAWIISMVLFLPSVREYKAPLWTVFCLPAIAAFYLAATIESAIRYWTGRGGFWKGRVQDS
jgi:hopene-associated glycosyltransferase HpnB